MLDTLLRKSRQLAADPVLRRWLLLRAFRLTPGEPAFTPHRPPYLGRGWRGLPAERSAAIFALLPEGKPLGELTLQLAGEKLTIRPGEEGSLVTRQFTDVETLLSFHRFAWVPLLEPTADARWVGAIWRVWRQAFGQPDSSWAWHPYTAAERAITLTGFFRRHGIPAPAEDAVSVLVSHVPVIAKALEWFGPHHTSNHCANNGRGLYLLGLALGLPGAADAGAKILLEEGQRLFRPSGVLREGSTHYHLLLTRQWASVWLAARAAGRPEADSLEATLTKALSVLPHLCLPGRFPLMGDISPDCPPDHLFGLLPGGPPMTGWTGALPPADRQRLIALRDSVAPSESDALKNDGWLKAECGSWAGLWHGEPGGWSPMPGHGHQDCGAPELHYERDIVFVDPGRGSYEIAGEADPAVAGDGHGGLIIDGLDPYPQNRPYYAPAFRAKMAGPVTLDRQGDCVTLSHAGYARLGVSVVRRRWDFALRRLEISDSIDGTGDHQVIRRLITPMPAVATGNVVNLDGPSGRRYRLFAENGAHPVLSPVTLWRAYGVGDPGTAITFGEPAMLPWHGRLFVEVL